MELVLIVVAVFLSFSNGANDNFKGFATVWGSNTLSYRQALILASAATALGSLASLVLAQALVAQFTGRGIVPDDLAGNPSFALSAGAGAAATVMLATRAGLPISTTHALIGGLIGAGLARNGGVVHFGTLAGSFLLPLLFSPLIAASLASVVGRVMHRRQQEQDCACVVAPAECEPAFGGAAFARRSLSPEVVIATSEECDRLPGTVTRWPIAKSLDRVHVLSAASICFARGVNDTPKLTALLMTAGALGAQAANAGIMLAMVAGGLFFSRRVATTMSRRMAGLDHARGLAANLVTAGLVLVASKYGLPVSTTHVSVGSIAGVGMSARALNWHTTRNVLLSWVGTLPLAAATAFLVANLV